MRFMQTIKGVLNRAAVSGAKGAYLGNLLIGCSVAFLIYFIEQTGLVGFTLRRILYLLLLSFEALFRYTQGHTLSLAGMVLDLLIIASAALIWTSLKLLPARILGNLLLLLALVPVTIVLFNRSGILIRGVPILAGILLAIVLDASRDLLRSRLRRRITAEKQEAEFSVVRHLAHNVKPNLQIARSPLLALREFLERRGFSGEVLARRLDGTPETVIDALDQAVAGLTRINDIIDSTRMLVTREISRDDFRETELKELLEREVLPLYCNDFRVVLEGGPVRVWLHRESFVEALHNILRNAKIHGFSDPVSDPTVRFSLRTSRKNAIIDYSNNGRPFPANLSTSDFLAFGKKSVDSPGEGLGGAWVGKVIEAHGGTFAVVRDNLPVHFRMTLPKGAS